MFAVDAGLRLRVVSEVAQEMLQTSGPLLGRELEEVLGSLWGRPRAGEMLKRFRHTLETGQPYQTLDAAERHHNGRSSELFDWRIERIFFPDGQPGVICHFLNLHESQPLEVRLRESETRLELAATAAELGIYDYDAASDRIEWDWRIRRMWGVDDEEPVNFDTFISGVHPADREATAQAVARSLEPDGDGRFRAEYRVVNRHDGTTHWVAATGQAFFEPATARRLVGTVQDISRRKDVETTLRAFYEASPLLMGTVELPQDGDLLHLYDNPATSRFFGVEPGSTHGRLARSLGVPEPLIRVWREKYEECSRTNGPVTFECWHTLESGQSRLLSVTVAPLGANSASGKPAYCYVAEDITERREAERMLAAAVAELEAADQRKDEFLATLSHELRNPLAPIRTAAQVLSSPSLAAAQLQWAQSVIQRQVRHMALLLDDLLDLARITQGKLTLKKERVALHSIVDAAVEAARPLIDEKRHQLTVALPAQIPMLEADPLRLAQVVANLLTNAAKYTDPGGRIDLTAHVEDRSLCLCVRDDGIGIPSEALRRIFTMFSQVEGTAARAQGGLGIGLALVRGLVELHGGTVHATSGGPGQGSEFKVCLPLAAEEQDAAPARPPGQDLPAELRVLVADDNRDAADTLALLLGLVGHQVRIAYDGAAAVSLARAFRPDVALLDIGMPELDGYQVARELRAEPWGRAVRLIAITGWGQDEDRRRAMAAGFDEHLTKPVDPQVLEGLLTGHHQPA